VTKVLDAHETTATLNVALSDGRTVVATRASVHERVNSLHLARGSARWPDAIVLASEPLDDDPAWQPVPEHHLVRVDVASAAVELRPLPTGSVRA
jgi:glutamine amidotransferase